MGQRFIKTVKKVAAAVLAFVLVVTGIYVGNTTVEASTNDMSVSGVDNFVSGNGTWDFYLGMNGTWPTTGGFEQYTNTSVTVTIKNAAGTELTTVSGGVTENYKNGTGWLLKLWGEYTKNHAPAEGDTVTISSGQLTATADETKIVNFAEETVLKYDGSTWSIYVEETESEMSVSGVDNFVSGNGTWDFYLGMNGTWPTTGNFEQYTNTSLTVTIKNAAGTELATVSGGVTENYKNGTGWLLKLWGEYTKNHAPAEGDTVTISSGQLTASVDETKIVNFAEDTVLEYDGSTWSICVEKTESEMSVSGVDNFVSGNGTWDFYLGMNGTWPTTGGFEQYTNTSVTVTIKNAAGTELTTVSGGVTENYKNGTGWLLKLWGEYTNNHAPAEGDTVTISSGQLTASADETKIVNFAEDTVLEYDGSTWSIYVEKTESEMSIDSVASFSTENGDWRFNLNVTGTWPTQGNFEEYTSQDISVEIKNAQGSSLATVNTELIKNYKNADCWLLCLWGEYTKNHAPAEGDTITISTGKMVCAGDTSKIVNLITEYSVVYSHGAWVAEGEVILYKEFAFCGMNAATQYNEEKGWFFYLEPDAVIPGTGDRTYFTGITMSINNDQFEIPMTKSAYQDTMFMLIPQDKLPQHITSNTKIIIHEGYGVSSDGSDGIHLKKDFIIYANQYGMSVEGFLQKEEVIQENVVLSLDKNTAYGGNEKGIYVDTTDKFPVDTTWKTHIKAVSYDTGSGVFLNDKKIDAPIIRYAEGKGYIGLADAGITAKDKDKLTIKGNFVINGVGVSYREVTFYYNGKVWASSYEPAKPESYKQIAATSVNTVSGWNERSNRWDIYLNLNAMLPGEIDKISFHSLTIVINGETFETDVYHSYQDTLFFPIEESQLSTNCKDGIAITLKAGKALAGDRTTGIEFIRDFTFYTYKGSFTELQPTSNTKWQDVTIISMLGTGHFNDDMRAWTFHLNLRQPLSTESGTVYLELPIRINGKTHEVKAQQDGDYLYFVIPESILPKDTQKATIAIEKGAAGYANAGRDGIRITETWTTYLFQGAISENEFTEVEVTETKIIGVQNVTPYSDGYHVYLRLNKEFPGNAWYEKYEDFEYYYNGKKVICTARKSESSNNKFMYFPIETAKVGTPKEGDIVTIKSGTQIKCGGYEIWFMNEFMLMYSDGIWSQYMKTDVKAPKDTQSLWEVARFAPGYIPMAENGAVMYSNEDKYNAISSMEPMKDYTISFNAKKMYDDETTSSFGVILRGNAVSEDEPMTKDLLYGYVVTFSAWEMKEDEESEGIWTGYINLWKNGENHSLLDQYRISYTHDTSDHPYFQYEKDYNYEFSIYNITETCVCITVKVNGKLVMRYYDEAGSDPFDPAVNTGTFQVYAGCPNYITDDIAELSAVISEQDECEVGRKIRVAATYPSVLENAEFEVDKEGATVRDGVFVATKPGSYTVSCTYNGTKLTAKTITVTEGKMDTVGNTKVFPVIPVVIGVAIVAAGAIIGLWFSKKRRQEKLNEGNK